MWILQATVKECSDETLNIFLKKRIYEKWEISEMK